MKDNKKSFANHFSGFGYFFADNLQPYKKH